MSLNPVELSLFASRVDAICDEMGAQLRRAAFSPNIRDRLDFSCAIFDVDGELCAQAAHIPVHLGSMAYAMRTIVGHHRWQPGDMLILNDPYEGGTHLPDVTVIAPVFADGRLAGFVANRAHHADIGAESPGSMPLSRTLEEEGMVISPVMLYRAGERVEAQWRRLVDSARNPDDSAGDFNAQLGANRRGRERLSGLIESMGYEAYRRAQAELNDYAETLAASAIAALPAGDYRFTDYMDDDGQGVEDIPICVSLKIDRRRVDVDFTGTAGQVAGNINCPLSVAAAGVFYVFRCLMPEQTPSCAGMFRPIAIRAPEGSLVNARRPAAVAAGNVETSMRIVDAVMGALARALPERLPAAGAGTMNNVALGWPGDASASPVWDYYETIGGGAGASVAAPGLSAVQTHMTNTLNTPIEVLEMKYPLRVTEYAVRAGSGGAGKHRGGDGIVREFEFLDRARGTVLTERRRRRPWGQGGGDPGRAGCNMLNGREMSPKATFEAGGGDRLRLETPGGGGYGRPEP